MTLCNIIFDSETETSLENCQNHTNNHKFSSVNRNDENSTPQTNSLNKKSSMSPRRTIRFISDEDEVLSTPKKPLKPAPNGLLTISITREKKKKINGVRYYFRCFLKQNGNHDESATHTSNQKTNLSKQIFIAKAKKQNSKIIPITDSETIHLRTPMPLAILEMDNENSEFTLIQNKPIELPDQHSESSPILTNTTPNQSMDVVSNQSTLTTRNNNDSDRNANNNFNSTGQMSVSSANKTTSNIPKHIMVIKFTIPRDHFDGTRKVHIALLTKTDVPSPLVSLPVTSISGYEGRYMIYSIKNSIIVDEKTKTPIITIRKTGSKELEIDTHFDLPPLWLFGLGIASFLGKKPSH